MAKLTDEMKALIKEVRLGIAATADKSGMPNASFKGSLQVLDDEHLIFADLMSPKTRKNLQENNKICILVGDHKKMVGYQFKGEAELLNEGELFDKVSAGIAKAMPQLPKATYVVKIKVDEITPAPAARK